MTTAFVFPGQGSQFVGMTRDLAERYPTVRQLWQQADEGAGYALSSICFEGPEDTLRQTLNAQPGILVAGLAALEAWRQEGNQDTPAFVAGHSLGEYTALVAAGSLDVAEAVRLVRARGEAMQAAGEQTPSGMAAIIGLDEAVVQQICDETGIQIANYNCPGQLVVSGTKDGVTDAMSLARDKGARPVVALAVSAAFHSRLMESAADTMAGILDQAEIRDAAVPLVANVSGQPLTAAPDIRQELKDQICAPVRWETSVRTMADAGVTRFIEFGPGKVLTGMIKRTIPAAELHNVSDLKSLGA
jgi:[acyl-carrier-protein] S-malonyltransferase